MSSWSTRRLLLGLLAALALAFALWYTGRPAWRTRRLFAGEVERFRTAGAAGYMQDTRRYRAFNDVVETGEPAGAVLLPHLRSADEAERFVAAALLGTVLRQAAARTTGTKSASAAPISPATRDTIVAELRRLQAAARPGSYLRGMIGRDLAHVESR